MTKFRLLAAGMLMSLIVLAVAPIASAHVLKQSNGVSVVMHIAPFDDPTANEPTRLQFAYGNDAGNFSLADYSVSYRLTLDNKLVTQGNSPAAYFGSAAESIATVNFPRVGVYELTVTGQPTVSSVPSFQVSYDIRVDHSTAVSMPKNSNGTLVLLLGAGAVLGFILLAGWQIRKGGRYKPKVKIASNRKVKRKEK